MTQIIYECKGEPKYFLAAKSKQQKELKARIKNGTIYPDYGRKKWYYVPEEETISE